MSNFSDLQITSISPEVHLLPGIGKIEYIYTAKPTKHLTINIDSNELKVIEGNEARRVYFDVIGMNEDTDALEAQLNAACLRAWNIPFSNLRENTRREEVKDKRQIVMWWMRKNTKMSLREIGLCLGGFDHATVLWAVKRITSMQLTDKLIKHDLNSFLNAFKEL